MSYFLNEIRNLDTSKGTYYIVQFDCSVANLLSVGKSHCLCIRKALNVPSRRLSQIHLRP